MKLVNLACSIPLQFGVFSCCSENYPIGFILLSKAFCCESYQYKNRAVLFVLNGNKKSIQYEFHNEA